ncbi:methyltransferase [Algoriphagus sp. SE2]|uniref:tRNA1(Val) (adenine(37)-N6)-methyltransferase n=1 Tax=Algoriphagus sp. SE2 TaxID=3141536 RepID=UPI0031CDA780
MPNNWFQFQQFRINQDGCAMKISTDAVLLGGLAGGKNPQNILDIGTGTGVIALMLAQRFTESQIDAVELDELAAKRAKNNFSESPFSYRLMIWEGAFQSFEPNKKFDLIVSNPPYFQDHLKSKDEQRNKALHTDALSFADLVSKVSKLLNAKGDFWVILPSRQMMELIEICSKIGLFPNRKFLVHDKPGKKVIREIVCFSFLKTELVIEQIFIKSDNGVPHFSYKNIVKGFLLEFT